MNLFPENIDGQRVKTDVKGLGVKQGFIAHIEISDINAVSGSNTGILAETTLTTEVQAITEAINNPGTPRNIRIIGNIAGITGNVTIKGTNYNNDPIIETLALNGTTVVEGAKAFKTVTEIDLPVQITTGNTVSVGFGEKLGLPYRLPHNTVRAVFLNNIQETVAPLVTTSPTDLEDNTIKLNSTLNGTAIDIYLFV